MPTVLQGGAIVSDILQVTVGSRCLHSAFSKTFSAERGRLHSSSDPCGRPKGRGRAVRRLGGRLDEDRVVADAQRLAGRQAVRVVQGRNDLGKLASRSKIANHPTALTSTASQSRNRPCKVAIKSCWARSCCSSHCVSRRLKTVNRWLIHLLLNSRNPIHANLCLVPRMWQRSEST